LTRPAVEYSVVVTAKNPVRRIAGALSALEATEDPIVRLDAARRVREAADELEAAQVEAARKAGATWTEIGICYGLTKQGAQQRFRAGDGAAGASRKETQKKKKDL
jgi:molybdenum cofactor biosynthesis enzyme